MGIPNIPGKTPTKLPSVAEPPLVTNPAEVVELLFSTMVLYGSTGSRKTSQLGDFAKYIYEKTGKTTRLISADGGGYGPVQNYVNAGIIEPWRLVEEPNPKSALMKASRGAWPEKLVNGLNVNNRIIEPSRGARREALKAVGAYAIEGWTSIASLLMRDSVSKGQKISEDVVGQFVEEGETFGAPARSHYGFVQNLTLDYIRNFSSLQVERVCYTALEGKGEDKITNKLEYGPMVAGKAITAAIPQYVGDCLHFEDYTIEVGVDKDSKAKLLETGVRAWFQQHPDPQTGVNWPAKSRLIPSKFLEFREKMGKYGYFNLNEKGLGEYLRLQDDLLRSSSEDLRRWKEEVDKKRNGS